MLKILPLLSPDAAAITCYVLATTAEYAALERAYRRALTNACELAGVEHSHPHSLRHASGQWLIDQGVPIEVVRKMLGHTNTATTERIYARIKSEHLGDRILDVLERAYTSRVKRKARRLGW